MQTVSFKPTFSPVPEPDLAADQRSSNPTSADVRNCRIRKQHIIRLYFLNLLSSSSFPLINLKYPT